MAVSYIDWVRAFCLSLPHTTEKVQWVHDLLFCIGGKMYCVVNLEPGLNPTKIAFKCNAIVDEVVIIFRPVEHDCPTLEDIRMVWIGQVAFAEFARDNARFHDRRLEQISGKHLEAGVLHQRTLVGADHVGVARFGLRDVLAGGLAVDRERVPVDAARSEQFDTLADMTVICVKTRMRGHEQQVQESARRGPKDELGECIAYLADNQPGGECGRARGQQGRQQV